KRLSWPNGPFKPISSDPAERFYRLDENRNYSDDPDDDAEEREERRKLKQRMIERQRLYQMTEMEPSLEKELEEQDETHRQLDDLLNLPLIKQMMGVRGRFYELRLGLKIAKIVGIKGAYPEFGLTYKELAFELFPQARTKNDKELEPYMQRIVRAIDTVQIYIITRYFRKKSIRIFPIALPLKQYNGIERVFNGYKKKYIDKVLLEFI